MTDFIRTLHEWVEKRGAEGLHNPWLVFKESDASRPKKAAWVEFEGPDVLGQVIVWESGECEVDLGSGSEASRTLIRSVDLSTNADLDELLTEITDFCAQY